jgi:hypothetical protein
MGSAPQTIYATPLMARRADKRSSQSTSGLKGVATSILVSERSYRECGHLVHPFPALFEA